MACSQLDKLKAAILDVGQENITPQRVQEDGHDHAIAICIVEAKLNVCIRHHQDIMEYVKKIYITHLKHFLLDRP